MVSLCRLVVGIAMLVLATPCSGAEPVDAGVVPPIRFGVSARTIGDVNRNDALAALRVWIDAIGRDRGIHFETEPRVFDTVEQLAAALKAGEIDFISTPMDDFLVLERVVPLAGAYTTVQGGGFTEEYVLLVRRDSPIHTLADLRDRRFMLLTHPGAGLAPAWLDMELARGNLPPRSGFFREIATATRPSRAILPVFFGQADACLVTRKNFAVAVELNPQLSAQLRVLAASPPLVPGLGAHRASVPAHTAEQFRNAITRLADTPAGRNILHLFQCDAIVTLSEADLAPTRAFLAERARLMKEATRKEGAHP